MAPPRRLSRQARRQQLVGGAMALAARQGLAGLSLEDLAARVGVTRNLLYHYFPRGRDDIAVAVVEEAERQLGPRAPQTVLAAMLDHALAPTHAWRIHRMAAATSGPEVRGIAARATQRRVKVLLGAGAEIGEPEPSGEPEPIAEVALRGYLGFAAAALDHGRVTGLTRADLVPLLEKMLQAALDAART